MNSSSHGNDTPSPLDLRYFFIQTSRVSPPLAKASRARLQQDPDSAFQIFPQWRNWQRMAQKWLHTTAYWWSEELARHEEGCQLQSFIPFPGAGEHREELPGTLRSSSSLSSPGPGLCLQAGSSILWAQTLWFAALDAALAFLSLHTPRSSGVWIWIMRRMHNPIAAVHFISSQADTLLQLFPKIIWLAFFRGGA